MVWDLGRAMARKQEFETARLDDFDFRLRARAMRRLADALDVPADDLVKEIALRPDQDTLALLANDRTIGLGEIERLWTACLAEARTALIRERGDPSPHRLA